MTYSRWHADQAEADAEAQGVVADKAREGFRRTAAELAGNDETLQRVLLARLSEAYIAGIYDGRIKADHFVWTRADDPPKQDR